MYGTIRDAIEEAIAKLRALQEDHDEYRVDPPARRVDQERAEETFAHYTAETEQIVNETVRKASERVRADFAKLRTTRYDEVRIAEESRRVNALRQAGIGLPEIIERFGTSRELLEAVRREAPVAIMSANPTAGRDEVDEQIRATELSTIRREIEFMPPMERTASERFVALLDSEPALTSFEKLVADYKATGRIDPTLQISLGLTLGEKEPVR